MKIHAQVGDAASCGLEDTAIVLSGPENVRVCVPSWGSSGCADPNSMFLVLAMLWKSKSTTKPAPKGLKVTAVSVNAARDGVLPFIVEDEIHSESKQAIRQIRTCSVAHELILSSQSAQERQVVMHIIRTFNNHYAQLVLAEGPSAGLFRPFDDWKRLYKSRFEYEENVLAEQMAHQLACDLEEHYKLHRWWQDDEMSLVDIIVACYCNSFGLSSEKNYFSASLLALKTRVWDHFGLAS